MIGFNEIFSQYFKGNQCEGLLDPSAGICLIAIQHHGVGVTQSQIIIWDGLQSSKQQKLFGADAKCQMMSSFFVYNL